MKFKLAMIGLAVFLLALLGGAVVGVVYLARRIL